MPRIAAVQPVAHPGLATSCAHSLPHGPLASSALRSKAGRGSHGDAPLLRAWVGATLSSRRHQDGRVKAAFQGGGGGGPPITPAKPYRRDILLDLDMLLAPLTKVGRWVAKGHHVIKGSRGAGSEAATFLVWPASRAPPRRRLPSRRRQHVLIRRPQRRELLRGRQLYV